MVAEYPLLLAKLSLVLIRINYTRVKRLNPIIKALVEDTEDKGSY